MKKSLLAVAALGAFASAAQAQSSVTVYGILDVGYVGSTSRASNNTGTTPTSNGAVTTTTNGFLGGAESTSRLGFKGVEDLGGGLSAFFTIETALTPDAGNVISTSNTANRQTFAGLKKKGVGSFAFGTQYTVVHDAVSATDPGNTNNMMGNVIYDKKAGATISQNGSAAAGTWNYSGQQTNTAYTVRYNNMLTLKSDTFAGFQGNAFYVLNNSNTNSVAVTSGQGGYSGGTTNQTGWGLGVNYTWTKLLVTANVQQFSSKSAYTVNANGSYASGAPVMNGWDGTASQTGVNNNDTQQYYAATYDFGILKGYLQYVNRKTVDAINPNNSVARTAQQIGVRSYITPTIESWASVGTGKYTVNNAGGTTGVVGTNTFVGGLQTIGNNAAQFGGYQLGANYWLSKRTNLYAIYGNQRTSNQVHIANGNPTSYNSADYALGLRHTF
jgi:predicted porin